MTARYPFLAALTSTWVGTIVLTKHSHQSEFASSNHRSHLYISLSFSFISSFPLILFFLVSPSLSSFLFLSLTPSLFVERNLSFQSSNTSPARHGILDIPYINIVKNYAHRSGFATSYPLWFHVLNRGGESLFDIKLRLFTLRIPPRIPNYTETLLRGKVGS